MPLDPKIVDAVIAAADAGGIPRDALLAVVEVESAGAAFEEDGTTPRLLFERHVFHRMLQRHRPDLLKRAVSQGLAIPKWNRSTQYKDQGRSAGRLALIARARAIDPECANLSCSWGLGQTMGFLYEELGFGSATEMLAWMTAGGIPAQIEAMVREIRKKSLIDEMIEERYADFARIYNGPGYRLNKYDTKLQAADDSWEKRLAKAGTEPAHARLADFEIEAVQRRLVALNIWPGKIDGLWGSKTTGAVSTFQAWQGLPVTGDYDDATRVRLADASLTPMPVAQARAETTVQDLRQQGSQTVAAADKGRAMAWGIGLFGTGGVLDKLGALDGMKGVLDQAQALRPLVDGLADLGGWLFSAWPVLLIAAAVVLWQLYGRVIRQRLADEISGRIA